MSSDYFGYALCGEPCQYVLALDSLCWVGGASVPQDLPQCRDGHHDDGPVPPYVEREFRRYLDCGILAHGFARARCGKCGHDFLIAFSCKGRGVCPSCNARRMVETAAHRTDHVVPPLPVRQWVLAVPKRLRYFLQRDADLQGAALRLFLRAVEECLRAHSPRSGPAARLGAVAFIHRFGSSLNAHLHFHCVVIDGVFESADRAGRERLLRYCARPPFALDRLRELGPERLRYALTKPGPGGASSLLLTPVVLIDRIAALVPPPRLHRHRYFGVLAPNAQPARTPGRRASPAHRRKAPPLPHATIPSPRRLARANP